MDGHTRMSPLTALFIGLFGVGAVGIASGTVITLYAMRVIDQKAGLAIDLVDDTLDTTLTRLPEILDRLPESIQELLNDRRALEYAANIDVQVDFVVDERTQRLRPVMTVVNRGDQAVSLLAVRVAALSEQGIPMEEWTELVATPFALEDDDWRGPILPGGTRHVLVESGWPGVAAQDLEEIMGVVEIADIRVWRRSELDETKLTRQ